MGPNENKTTPVSESPAQPSNFEDDFRSSLSSDIMIEPDKKPRRKLDKKVVVIIILLIALAIIGVFALFSTGAVKLSKTNLGDVKTAYTRFANMVIDGKDSKDEIKGEYDGSKNYFFTGRFKTQDDAKAYFDKLSDSEQKLKDVINKWKPSDKRDDLREIADYIKDEIAMHELFELIYTKPLFNHDDFMKYYAENGKEKAEQYINDFYPANDNNEYIKELREKFKAAGDAIISTSFVLEEIGCDKTKLNYTCLADKGRVDQRDQVDFNEGIVREYYTTLNGYTELKTSYLRNAFSISELIRKAEKK